jgi:hypothetical protein
MYNELLQSNVKKRGIREKSPKCINWKRKLKWLINIKKRYFIPQRNLNSDNKTIK